MASFGTLIAQNLVAEIVSRTFNHVPQYVILLRLTDGTRLGVDFASRMVAEAALGSLMACLRRAQDDKLITDNAGYDAALRSWVEGVCGDGAPQTALPAPGTKEH